MKCSSAIVIGFGLLGCHFAVTTIAAAQSGSIKAAAADSAQKGMVSAVASTERYQYDELGRLTAVTYVDGSRMSFTYDAAGNMLEVASVVNHSPVDFTRVAPADSAYVQTDTLTFVWNSSIDPDGDPVGYEVAVHASGIDTTLATTDTTIAIPASALNISAERVEVLWSVRAGDGFLERDAANGQGVFFASEATNVSTEDLERPPASFALHAAYPNPFNPSTIIPYDMPTGAHVRLTIYNVLGREIATLVNEKMPPGRHETQFQANGLPSGLYVYVVEMGGFRQTRTMLLVK